MHCETDNLDLTYFVMHQSPGSRSRRSWARGGQPLTEPAAHTGWTCRAQLADAMRVAMAPIIKVAAVALLAVNSVEIFDELSTDGEHTQGVSLGFAL